MGGELPTVTDANLVLGRINPEVPLGNERNWHLDVSRAELAITTHIGSQLNLSPLEAAYAIVEVANAKMAGSIRMISVERGHDPRDFVLVAFGGGGPLHAGALQRELGLAKVIVPYYPGLTSALGFIMADARHDFLQTINRRVEDLDMIELHQMFREQFEAGRQLLAEEGIRIERIEALYQADMAYDGQIHEVRTPLPSGTLSRDELVAAFESSYHTQYGDTLGNPPIKVNTILTTVILKSDGRMTEESCGSLILLKFAFPFSFRSINLILHQISLKPLLESKQTPWMPRFCISSIQTD